LLSEFAVAMITGTDASAGFARIARSTSSPDIPGIITSSNTRSTWRCARSSSATGPLSATATP